MWFSFNSFYLEFMGILGYVSSCLLPKFGGFEPLFLQIISPSLYLSLFFLGLSQVKAGPLGSVLHVPEALSTYLQSFFFFFFQFSRLDLFNCPIFKFAESFFLPVQICLWIPPVNFSHQWLYFSSLVFFFPFFWGYLLVDISILIKHGFPDFLHILL